MTSELVKLDAMYLNLEDYEVYEIHLVTKTLGKSK